MNIGIKGRAETVVSAENTAKIMGSGDLDVFATPHMVALMENAAAVSVADELEDGMSTVGTKLEISHDAATPVGMKVWAESRLVEVDGRRLVFEVSAFDECGPIGHGWHERFIINKERFLAKTNAKAAK